MLQYDLGLSDIPVHWACTVRLLFLGRSWLVEQSGKRVNMNCCKKKKRERDLIAAVDMFLIVMFEVCEDQAGNRAKGHMRTATAATAATEQKRYWSS